MLEDNHHQEKQAEAPPMEGELAGFSPLEGWQVGLGSSPDDYDCEKGANTQ